MISSNMDLSPKLLSVLGSMIAISGWVVISLLGFD